MLKQNEEYKTNDVITLKLSTGEEVIGYYSSSSDSNQITLRKPIVPVGTGDGQVGFAPFLMTSDYLHNGTGEISFARSALVTHAVTSKQFADAYSQQVSGIDRSASKQPGLII